MISKLTETIRDQISTLPRWPQSVERTQQQLRTDSIAMNTSRYKQPEKSALRKTDPAMSGFRPDSNPDSFVDDYAADYAIKLAELEEQQWRSLWFPVIDDREEQIARAELKTFDWILEPPQSNQRKWDSFIDWLKGGESIYWINGKAGSGKSTLMKYLKNHAQVDNTLKSWAGDTPLIIASFFFWYNGNLLQKSQEGLLRSILFQALENHRELIPTVLSEATKIPVIDLANFWSLPRLKCAFKKLLEQKQVPMKICLLIDGLDEYAGDHAEIAEVFRHVAQVDHVKICVSSRPLLLFDRAFKDFPGLMLQNLTFDDIQTYVQKKFNDDERFRELEVEEPTLSSSLALQVVTKASGVFLWVKLVVHSLLEGIQNYDRGIDLERRLNELPEDLDDLYWHMLDRVKPVWYLEEGFRLLLLVHAAVVPPTLLQVAFVDRQEQSPTAENEDEELSIERQNALCKSMAGRIKSRCLGLLEVTDMTYSDEKYRRVQFLHKSVKDFIETPKLMRRIDDCLASKELFMPEVAIIKALLFELSTVKSRLHDDQFCREGGLSREAWFDEVRPLTFEAIRYAAIAEAKYPKARLAYTPLVNKIEEITNSFWESVSFRSPEEVRKQVHWCLAPRKPKGTTLQREDTIGQIRPPSYTPSEDGDSSPETIEGRSRTSSLTSSSILVRNDDPIKDTWDAGDGGSFRVRFSGLPIPRCYPGNNDDDRDKPTRRWPTRIPGESPFDFTPVDSLTVSCEFERLVRGLGLEKYADERFPKIGTQGPLVKNVSLGMHHRKIAPKDKIPARKAKRSVWGRLKAITSRKKRTKESRSVEEYRNDDSKPVKLD